MGIRGELPRCLALTVPVLLGHALSVIDIVHLVHFGLTFVVVDLRLLILEVELVILIVVTRVPFFSLQLSLPLPTDELNLVPFVRLFKLLDLSVKNFLVNLLDLLLTHVLFGRWKRVVHATDAKVTLRQQSRVVLRVLSFVFGLNRRADGTSRIHRHTLKETEDAHVSVAYADLVKGAPPHELIHKILKSISALILAMQHELLLQFVHLSLDQRLIRLWEAVILQFMMNEILSDFIVFIVRLHARDVRDQLVNMRGNYLPVLLLEQTLRHSNLKNLSIKIFSITFQIIYFTL